MNNHKPYLQKESSIIKTLAGRPGGERWAEARAWE